MGVHRGEGLWATIFFFLVIHLASAGLVTGGDARKPCLHARGLTKARSAAPSPTSRAGRRLLQSSSPSPSACPFDDGTVVRCASTGEIEYIEAGQRRWFSEEAWASTGAPDLILEEAGDCPKIKACPEGQPMPVQPQADLIAASPEPDASPSPGLDAPPSPDLANSPSPNTEVPASPQQPSPNPQQSPSRSPQQQSPSPKQPSPSPQQPSPSPKQPVPSPQQQPAGRKQPTPGPQQSPASPRQPSPRPMAPKPSPQAQRRSPSPSPAAIRPDFSGGSCPDPAAALNFHNYIRQQHGAVPLTWSPQLAASAQKFANSCAFKHSGGPFGENIMMGYGLYRCRQASRLWAGEVVNWNKGSNRWTPAAGHFTQMVWKATTHMGCGWANCPGKGVFMLCHYNPRGNVMGWFGRQVD